MSVRLTLLENYSEMQILALHPEVTESEIMEVGVGKTKSLPENSDIALICELLS